MKACGAPSGWLNECREVWSYGGGAKEARSLRMKPFKQVKLRGAEDAWDRVTMK